MIDTYIRRETSRRGCLLILLAAAVLCAGGAVYWFGFYGRPSKAPAQPPEAAKPAKPAKAAKAAATNAPAAGAKPPAKPAELADLDILDKARRLQARDKLQEAREKCLGILSSSSNAVARTEAESLLNEIDIALVTTPRAMPEKKEYTVQSGDSLIGLAKKFNTTADLIRKGNELSGSMIRVSQRLRIFSGQFSIEVDKSDNTLLLKLNDRYFKRYRVGTGQYGKTPIGAFRIMQKIPQPTWWRPDGKAIPYGDTNNLLGTHWLSLNAPGYGIHGTWEPDTIGKQSSAGCIRLLNDEIEELFLLAPEGTPVTIAD